MGWALALVSEWLAIVLCITFFLGFYSLLLLLLLLLCNIIIIIIFYFVAVIKLFLTYRFLLLILLPIPLDGEASEGCMLSWQLGLNHDINKETRSLHLQWPVWQRCNNFKFLASAYSIVIAGRQIYSLHFAGIIFLSLQKRKMKIQIPSINRLWKLENLPSNVCLRENERLFFWEVSIIYTKRVNVWLSFLYGCNSILKFFL